MKKTNRILSLLMAIIALVTVFLTGFMVEASAASYPAIPALKISRIYQSDADTKGMCYWCSMATVQGYCLGTYTYNGVTSNYRSVGTDYDYLAKKDAVSKKISTYNGTAVDSGNLTSFPVKMTLVTGCGNNASTYEKIYNQLKLGKPVIVYRYIQGQTNGRHASVVIGYNGSSTTLQASGFTVLEIRKTNSKWWNNSASLYNSYANKPQVDSTSGSSMSCYVNLESWCKLGGTPIQQICYPTNSVSGGDSGTTTPSVNFTKVWSDNITKTDAQINANFDLTYISSSGFYIGTSSTSLKKITKNLEGKPDGAGNFKNIYYKMSKWYGTLSPNTTYYYKLYVVKDGKEICTEVKSFKTLANAQKVLNSIEISSVPTTTQYNYKDVVSTTGLKVIAKYSDGSSKDVTSQVKVSNFTTDTTGNKTATVEFEGKTATFNYSVSYAWWQWVINIVLFGWIWY